MMNFNDLPLLSLKKVNHRTQNRCNLYCFLCPLHSATSPSLIPYKRNVGNKKQFHAQESAA